MSFGSTHPDVTLPKPGPRILEDMVITVASRTPASLRAQKAVPLPQRYARALRWASRHAAGAPDLGLLKAMGRLERSLRQG